ncbi:MAG: phosphonate C-P lyase system protein PhnH [Ancalomicrobiaceae bacterium]|nr:phosphonate C-P lyase system protein PhnH [Ancalomicrobiaceae bacterium]
MPVEALFAISPRPGLADPVMQSQTVFRTVMAALAEPGTIHALPETLTGTIDAPAPITPAAAAILLALADYETPIFLDEAARNADVGAFLSFHCGSRITDSAGEASFALIADPTSLDRLDAFAPGTLDYPDRSTTLIVQVAELGDVSGEGSVRLRLTGPGIADTARIGFGPVNAGLVAALADNRARFPQGVDLIVTDGAGILGLPRSTRIEEEGF